MRVDVCVSALSLLVQEFDECQLQVGILKGRKGIFENLGQDRGKQFEKGVVGTAEDKKGKEATVFILSILSSIWTGEGKADRR